MYKCKLSGDTVGSGITRQVHYIMRPVKYEHYKRKFDKNGVPYSEYLKKTTWGYEAMEEFAIHPSYYQGEDPMPKAVVDPREEKTVKCYLD